MGGEEGGESIWFCFMIRRGGSVNFSEAIGPAGPCEWKGTRDGQEGCWWESWRHRGDGSPRAGFKVSSDSSRADATQPREWTESE